MLSKDTKLSRTFRRTYGNTNREEEADSYYEYIATNVDTDVAKIQASATAVYTLKWYDNDDKITVEEDVQVTFADTSNYNATFTIDR